MKRILYTVIVLLVFTNIMVAQLGVGTEAPNSSSQLEVVSADRGILIPRIELESTTDQSTIRNGNVNSMMVFNTQTVHDVSPRYYYWYVDKWYKLATTAGEIITTLIDNENGTYLYTSEDGTQTLIDIPTSVVNDIINQGDVYTEIINLIDTNETVTIIEDNGDGTYTYYNEDEVDANGDIIGTGVTIDVVGDVVTNIQNEGDIYNEIINLIDDNETVTTLVANADGKYTYTSEDGTVTVIDIPDSVVENFETIVNDGPVTVNGETFNTFEEYITHIANESVTIGGSDFINVTGSGTDTDPYVVAINEGAANSMLISNDNGDLEWVTIESIVQANETVTTIVKNADGTYTYTNEEEDEVVIDIPASVVDQFENIYNQIVNEEITI